MKQLKKQSSRAHNKLYNHTACQQSYQDLHLLETKPDTYFTCTTGWYCGRKLLVGLLASYTGYAVVEAKPVKL